jgi:regulator of sigma E protease
MEFLKPYLDSLGSIVMVVLGLGFIIFLHELGHFLMAKKNKVRVEVFSLGFGHAIFKFRRGETEYRVAWLPLGGYVKMAGESLGEERRGEPWELTSKTPWQRFQIFTAGAVMNLLIAFPIAIFSYAVGKYEAPNEVGVPGMAEAHSGMRPGDVIVEVDGRRITSLDQFRIEMIRRPAGSVVPVRVRRGDREETLQVRTMKSSYHAGTIPPTTRLSSVAPDSPAARAGVRAGDEIVRIDDRRVTTGREAGTLLRAAGGREVLLTLRRRSPDFEDTDYAVRLTVPSREWHVVPQDDNLLECIVGRVLPGTPAYDKLEPGDAIVRVGDRPVACWQDLRDAIEPNPDREFEIAVRRGDRTERVRLRTAYGADSGKGVIGIQPHWTNVVARVVPGSYYDRAGLKPGDRLKAVEGQPGEVTLASLMGQRFDRPGRVRIEVERAGESKWVALTLETERVTEGDVAALGLPAYPSGPLAGFLATEDSRPFRRRSLTQAVAAGIYEPYDITIMTFEVLKKLVTGGESAKGLSGPIGIIHVTYRSADLSFGNFLWLLCLITVNLGIFNLLPIPVLDGGHNVLLGIEVVRKWFGKPPPSEKFVATFQYAGLLFILALFLFVTYNDISKLIAGG